MLRTLRTRLIAAFAFVIFLSLVLASSAFVVLLREYQTEREVQRLQDLALPIAYQVRALEYQGATPAEIAAFLERQATDLHLRIAVINGEGVVIQDSTGEALGARVPLPPQATRGRRVFRASFQGPQGEILFFAAPVSLPSTSLANRVEDVLGRESPSYVALLQPSRSLQMAWLDLWPRLAGAALLSLLASVAVALILSNSIARPLAQMTRASEEMARGNYDQVIPPKGWEEVSRLASAFNHMARQVACSHRAMRDLLANVSHDLRTPLTSIQGFSQAMVDGTLRGDEAHAEAGQIIHHEAERMQRLVEDLLYLSQLQSGQLGLDRRRVQLTEVVEACAARTRRRAEAASVEFHVEVAARPVIHGDGGRLEQVVDNLLDNALRHTPAGGRIELQLRLAGAQAILAVHNTGSFIPPDDLSRIFERFYQVDKARSGPNEGSGLGLAIAQEIVQAHGGRLEAASSLTEGTTFSLSLPAGSGTADQELAVANEVRGAFRRRARVIAHR